MSMAHRSRAARLCMAYCCGWADCCGLHRHAPAGAAGRQPCIAGQSLVVWQSSFELLKQARPQVRLWADSSHQPGCVSRRINAPWAALAYIWCSRQQVSGAARRPIRFPGPLAVDLAPSSAAAASSALATHQDAWPQSRGWPCLRRRRRHAAAASSAGRPHAAPDASKALHQLARQPWPSCGAGLQAAAAGPCIDGVLVLVGFIHVCFHPTSSTSIVQWPSSISRSQLKLGLFEPALSGHWGMPELVDCA